MRPVRFRPDRRGKGRPSGRKRCSATAGGVIVMTSDELTDAPAEKPGPGRPPGYVLLPDEPMRMTITIQAAAELHSALGEAFALFNADPPAKVETQDAPRQS